MFTLPVGTLKSASGPAAVNLVHWVKSDVGVTKDGSNIVSAWADQSGNGTNWGSPAGASITWVSNQVNGYPILRSPGDRAGDTGAIAPMLTQPAFLTTGTNVPAEVFVVMKSTGGLPIYSWGGFATDGNSSHYPFSDGNIYDNFGSTSRQNSTGGGRTSACQAYGIFNISNGASAGSFIMRQNGTEIYNSGGTHFNSGWASTFRLFASGISAPSGYGMAGDIAELLIYNGVLSGTDRTTTYNYLHSKYAFTF